MLSRTFGRLGWPVSEIGYGMWGMGGWSGSDDEESLASLDRAVAGGVQLLRHRVRLRRGAQRAAARRHPAPPCRSPPVCRDQSAAEEPAMARAGRDAGRRRVPLRLHRRDDRAQPAEPRRRAHRPAAAPRVERRVGRRRRMEAGGRGPEAPRRDRGVRHQREPVGGRERPRRARDRAGRRGAGRLQHLRPGAARTCCFPPASAWTWR